MRGRGSVETVNGAMKRMFAAGLPRYAHAQLQASGKPLDPAIWAIDTIACSGHGNLSRRRGGWPARVFF